MKEVIAFVAAGFAAAVSRAALLLLAPGVAHGATSDPLEIRFVTGVVFFAILIMFGRRAFRNDVTGASGAITDTPAFTPKETPRETADAMARVFAGVTDDVPRQRAILNRSRRHWDTGFATEPQRHREDEWEKRRLY